MGLLNCQAFREMAARLGMAERRMERATVSLIAIVFVHLACHSVKGLVSAFQIYQVKVEEGSTSDPVVSRNGKKASCGVSDGTFYA